MKNAVEEHKIGDITEFELGPFYGLPTKVAEILKTHRKIEKLYGMLDFFC